MILKKRIIIIVFIPVVILLFTYFFLQYQSTKKTIDINTKNVKEVVIRDSEDYKTIKTTSESKDSVKLNKWQEYIVSYTGNDGYKGDEYSLYVDYDTNEINIDPYLSEDALKQKLVSEQTAINKELTSNYPGFFSLYKAKNHNLFGYGDFYGGLYQYTGNDVLKSDSVRVLMKKEGNRWMLLTKPPVLYLYKGDYKDTPEEILKEINKLN